MVKASLLFDPPVIEHRGVSSYAPENTMSAFTRAVQLGIQWVEFDVMLAACGTPIIIHDESLDRTTNGHGNVGDYSYSYLRTLDAGSWFSPSYSGERIPSLEEGHHQQTSTVPTARVDRREKEGHSSSG